MRGADGIAAFDEVGLLAVAVVAFSLFFASMAHGYVAREAGARGDRLELAAESLLDAVMEDPRWTAGRGTFLRSALDRVTTDDLVPLAAGRPFRVAVEDLVTGDRWTFGGDGVGGDHRTAATAGVVDAGTAHHARVTATVWGSG